MFEKLERWSLFVSLEKMALVWGILSHYVLLSTQRIISCHVNLLGWLQIDAEYLWLIIITGPFSRAIFYLGSCSVTLLRAGTKDCVDLELSHGCVSVAQLWILHDLSLHGDYCITILQQGGYVLKQLAIDTLVHHLITFGINRGSLEVFFVHLTPIIPGGGSVGPIISLIDALVICRDDY